MLTLVLGGSGSGKSEYAENLMVSRKQAPMYYIATMWFNQEDEECVRRIERHRQMRKDKGFSTIECPSDLQNVNVGSGSLVLLECMSNLVANEMFSDDRIREPEAVLEKIQLGMERLLSSCLEVCVVSNDIFGDGTGYDEGTMAYIEALGLVNQYLAARAESVTEVVYTIPVPIKQSKEKGNI